MIFFSNNNQQVFVCMNLVLKIQNVNYKFLFTSNIARKLDKLRFSKFKISRSCFKPEKIITSLISRNTMEYLP